MLLSEFVNTLYKYSDGSRKKADYFVFLFDTLIKDSPECINPFDDLQSDTLERYFNGKNIAKTKAHKARGMADIHKFAKHINGLSDSNQLSMENEFKNAIPDFNKDDNLGYACTDLFLQILDEIYDGTSVSNKQDSHLETKTSNRVAGLKLLYRSSSLSIPEQLQLKDSNTVVNINDAPTEFSITAPSNTVYRYQAEYQFKSAIAPDHSRQVKVSIRLNNIIYSGFTSTDNWESKSVMNNTIFAGNHTCTAWFYVVSANVQNPVVQFLMIGDTYE